MKKLLKLFLPVIICLSCLTCQAVSADDYEQYDFTYPNFVDDADLVDSDEEIAEELEEISDEYGIDVVIVTVDSIGSKSATAFADDFYDYNGYSEDGILFLLSMEHRDWAISTTGYGITAFTDYGCDYIFGCMKDSLADDDYEEAFGIFAEQCDDFLLQAENGEPYDYGNSIKTGKDYIMVIGVALVVGLAAAIIVSLILKSQLKSVSFQRNANSYIKNGSLKVTHSHDIYLYKTVSKTKRESNSGGSSTHRGSSGRSHGGSSGKF